MNKEYRLSTGKFVISCDPHTVALGKIQMLCSWLRTLKSTMVAHLVAVSGNTEVFEVHIQ